MAIINGYYKFNNILTHYQTYLDYSENFNFICNNVECNSFSFIYLSNLNKYEINLYNTETLRTGFYGSYDITNDEWQSADIYPPSIIFENEVTIASDVLDFIIDNTHPFNDKLTITLYQMECEKNRVNKELYIFKIAVIQGTLKDSTSITKPSIDFKLNDFTEFNYMYINKFNRYYFVDDVVSVKNKLWNVRASVDVLYSFINEIEQNVALIERCEDTSYINIMLDNDAITEKEVESSFIALPNDSPIDSSNLEGTNHHCFVVQVLADA